MAKILMIGLGDLGSRLALELAAQGHAVTGLRRSSTVLPGIAMLQADVSQPGLKLPEAFDYVFVILAPGESTEEAYRRTFVDGAVNILSAIDAWRPKRLFFVSSSAVYGQDAGEWVDERSVTAPGHFNGRCLLAAEQFFLAAPFPVTILRFAGIYGPDRLRLLRWAQAGRPVQSSPPMWTNRIHIEDCLGVLGFLLARDMQGVPLQTVYIGVDAEPVPQHEVLAWLAAELACPAPPLVAGSGQNKRLSNRRLSELGYVFRYPSFREGYRSVIGVSGKFR